MNKIIGRKSEQKLLKQALETDTSEFIAIYGRRRIGKTYLVAQYFRQFDDAVFFHVTGIKDAPYIQQRRLPSLHKFVILSVGTFM